MPGNDLGATACTDDQLVEQLKPGDVAWLKVDNVWWPCQVISEESVRKKPNKKVKDGVLVRMYGCYKYSYMDPVKCSAEFEIYLKQENLSTREAFQKALNEDLSHVIREGKSDKRVSESTVDTPKSKKQKQGIRTNGSQSHATGQKKPKLNGSVKVKETPKNASRTKKSDAEENLKPQTTPLKSLSVAKSDTHEESTPSLSERKLRVMQNLGLVAPRGSPYRRNGFVVTASLQ